MCCLEEKYLIFLSFLFFFFNDTATTEIYTLSLHDALPISFLLVMLLVVGGIALKLWFDRMAAQDALLASTRAMSLTMAPRLSGPMSSRLESIEGAINRGRFRSEEHTSELQSHSFISYAVFCLKKKKKK